MPEFSFWFHSLFSLPSNLSFLGGTLFDFVEFSKKEEFVLSEEHLTSTWSVPFSAFWLRSTQLFIVSVAISFLGLHNVYAVYCRILASISYGVKKVNL